MAVEITVSIDAEVESVGQFDRLEKWPGRLDVTRASDGRIRIGKPTQSGFAGMILDFDDLRDAVESLKLGLRP